MTFGTMTPEQLQAARLMVEFFLGETKRAPLDIEYAYRAFCVQLEIPADYHGFSRHYLHAYLLRNYESITHWLPSLGLSETYAVRIKFWRLATRLIYQDNLDNKVAPTLNTMIRGVARLPSIIQRAYPGIQNPTVKQRFREAL